MRLTFGWSVVVVPVLAVACGSSEEPTGTPATRTTSDAVLDAGAGGGGSPVDGVDGVDGATAPGDPGPPPEGCGDLGKDEDGFFRRDSGQGQYVAYVPAAYDGSPMRVLVGLHGCGDDARNFAAWGVAPYATRETQTHLAISVDGASGGGNCWDVGADSVKVAAAVEDLAKCVYVHRKKVVVAGYSSGGLVAYSVGLKNAGTFAGILVSNSNTWEIDALLAGASRKLPIAHRAHTGDDVFPIGEVRETWSKIEAAGFPLAKSEVEGGHDGTSDDWSGWLVPQMADWQTP